jgi:hypothetical protein
VPPARWAPCRLGLAVRRTCLGVCAGSFPTASRPGPPVPLRASVLGTCAALPYRRTAPCFARGPPSVSCTHASQGRSPYCGVTSSSYFDAQAEEPADYKSRPRCRAQAGRHGPPWTPHGELLSPGLATTNQAPNSSTQPPLQPPCAALASSQTGSPPEQSSPRPCSLRAAGRPAAGAPPPILGHKPVAGKPTEILLNYFMNKSMEAFLSLILN